MALEHDAERTAAELRDHIARTTQLLISGTSKMVKALARGRSSTATFAHQLGADKNRSSTRDAVLSHGL